jgi:hypothetical protein
MGIIKSLSSQEILVHFPEENKTIEVDKYEWQNIRYKVDAFTKVEEEVLGTFVHYPIKLAWAITVHKSQGLTLTKQRLMFHKFYARTSIRRIIAFALLRRAYFAFSTANERNFKRSRCDGLRAQ